MSSALPALAIVPMVRATVASRRLGFLHWPEAPEKRGIAHTRQMPSEGNNLRPLRGRGG